EVSGEADGRADRGRAARAQPDAAALRRALRDADDRRAVHLDRPGGGEGAGARIGLLCLAPGRRADPPAPGRPRPARAESVVLRHGNPAQGGARLPLRGGEGGGEGDPLNVTDGRSNPGARRVRDVPLILTLSPGERGQDGRRADGFLTSPGGRGRG